MNPALLLFAQTASTATTTATSTVVGAAGGDVFGTLSLLSGAFSSGWDAATAGLLLSLVVAGARFFKGLDLIKVPDSWDKWIAVALSMLTSVSVGLVAGKDALEILSTGLQIGVYAIGGWEVLLKPLRNKLLKKSKVGDASSWGTPPPPAPPLSMPPPPAEGPPAEEK